MLTAKNLIKLLKLKPLPGEGGFYRETYRSHEAIPRKALPARYTGSRVFCTAIYYLITPENFSTLHRVRSDEIFHFYQGDPAELFMIYPGGKYQSLVLGNDFSKGQVPQAIVPKGVWQGLKLLPGRKYALFGTTVSPGFDFSDFELGHQKALFKQYPNLTPKITRFTKPE